MMIDNNLMMIDDVYVMIDRKYSFMMIDHIYCDDKEMTTDINI